MTPNPENTEDEAFLLEITESQTLLKAYVWKMVGNAHHVEDVLQNTNIVLWQKRMEWDPETPFLKWAYRVAYFQTKAFLRDRAREKKRFVFNDDLLDSLAKDTPRFQDSQDLMDALGQCLSKLDQGKRSLLLKRYEDGSNVETMANDAGYKPNALSQLLRRLRSKLSDCITHQLKATPSW